MPVVIVSKLRYRGVATPEALNQETTVIEISPQSDEYMIEGYVDLSSMQDGDSVIIREYMRIGEGDPKPFIKIELNGVQSEPILRLYTKTIDRDSPYRVTITQTSGTIKSFPYVFFREDFGIS